MSHYDYWAIMFSVIFRSLRAYFVICRRRLFAAMPSDGSLIMVAAISPDAVASSPCFRCFSLCILLPQPRPLPLAAIYAFYDASHYGMSDGCPILLMIITTLRLLITLFSIRHAYAPLMLTLFA